jgi:N-terminal half of MaoC dehydratase
MTDYITDAVRAIIGQRSQWIETAHLVEAGEVRRFFQAIMDPNRRYWDAAYAAETRYGAPVAPPGFPVHAFRRRPEEIDDPFDNRSDPEFDGSGRYMRPGLPKVPVPLAGILNGGYEYEFCSYAKLGERIRCRSAYRDIYQRQGKAGPMVMVVIEDEYAAGDGRLLLKSVNTQIMR